MPFSQSPAASNGASNLTRPKGRGIWSALSTPRGSRQISMQAWLLGSLPAGIKALARPLFPGQGM